MSRGQDFDLRDFRPYLLNPAADEASLGFQRIYKDPSMRQYSSANQLPS